LKTCRLLEARRPAFSFVALVQDGDQSERSPEAQVGRIPEDLMNGTVDRRRCVVPQVEPLVGPGRAKQNGTIMLPNVV
jgi:hypothetical protein